MFRTIGTWIDRLLGKGRARAPDPEALPRRPIYAYCMKCRTTRLVERPVYRTVKNHAMLAGRCAVCGRTISKFVARARKEVP